MNMEFATNGMNKEIIFYISEIKNHHQTKVRSSSGPPTNAIPGRRETN